MIVWEDWRSGNADVFLYEFPELKIVDPDVNDDGRISVGDILLVANAFGSDDSEANFNPVYDLNPSGNITVGDIMIANNNFGSYYWPPFNRSAISAYNKYMTIPT